MALYRCGGGGSYTLLSTNVGFNTTQGSIDSPSINNSGHRVKSASVGYYFYSGGNYTRTLTWTVQGSNDNSNWLDVDSASASATANQEKYEVATPNIATNYDYYRLRITMTGGGNTRQSGVLTLMVE